MTTVGDKTFNAYYNENGITVAYTITITVNEVYVPTLKAFYFLNKTNLSIIDPDNQYYMIYVYGGEYGSGQYLKNVEMIYYEDFGGYIFAFELYDNVEEIYLYILDQEVDTTSSQFYTDFYLHKRYQTSNLTNLPSSGSIYFEFSFNTND